MSDSTSLLGLENEANLRKLIDVVRGSKLATVWFLHKHGLAGDQAEPDRTAPVSVLGKIEQTPAS